MPTVNRLLTKIISCLVCCNVASLSTLAAVPLATQPGSQETKNPPRIRIRASADNSYDANQAADLLGIRDKVDRLNALQNGSNSSANELEIVGLRSYILRKILAGYIEVRRGCNKLDIELAYTYDVMQRQQRKQAAVNQALNSLNFAQFGTLYTLEPYARVKHRFRTSGVMTSIGAGIGLTLPTIGIIYNKYAKAEHISPPAYLDNILDGKPVDGSGMPPLLEKYLDSHAAGSNQSRREEMFDLWKKRYHVDPANKDTLAGVRDKKKVSVGVLNTRIMLLWSLHTFVEDIDVELLALLNGVKADSRQTETTSEQGLLALGLKPGALEAARLLNIRGLIGEIATSSNNDRRDLAALERETRFLENVLGGALDMRIATDRVNEELNYAYDVVLSSLLFRRGSGLQKNFELNFIKTGFLGGVAGYMFLNHHAHIGDEMFLISSGLGCALSTIALFQMHGGSRKIDTPPNSLADFFNLLPQGEYQFSPLVSTYLNSPAPDSPDGKSRREHLLEIWKKERVATLDLDKKSNQEKIAAMPISKRDNIAVARNRIALLASLKARLESFDSELYDLVDAVESKRHAVDSGNELAQGNLTVPAAHVAGILGIKRLAGHLSQEVGERVPQTNLHYLDDQLTLTSKVFLTALDVCRTSDQLDTQIAKETQAMERMSRNRDMIIALTNNLNFYQINILGCIQDGPLGLSGSARNQLLSNRVNIICGLMIGPLGLAPLVEQRGGYRPNKAQPNMLGSCFGFDNPSESKLSPILSQFFDSVPPSSSDGLTRRQELIKYWKEAKLVTVNLDNKSTRQRLAALSGDRFFSESISLIRNRLVMLYDVRATVDLMDIGLSDLLESV